MDLTEYKRNESSQQSRTYESRNFSAWRVSSAEESCWDSCKFDPAEPLPRLHSLLVVGFWDDSSLSFSSGDPETEIPLSGYSNKKSCHDKGTHAQSFYFLIILRRSI